MTARCSECRYYQPGSGDYGECWFTPPASVAAALGLHDPYEAVPAKTHDDWCCSLFRRDDE